MTPSQAAWNEYMNEPGIDCFKHYQYYLAVKTLENDLQLVYEARDLQVHLEYRMGRVQAGRISNDPRFERAYKNAGKRYARRDSKRFNRLKLLGVTE